MRSALERYERIAPLYDVLDLPFEWARYRHIRPKLFAGLTGRILDAGVGTGRNVAYYPRGAEVTGIDLSPAMLLRAQARAERLSRRVHLQLMDVTRLTFPDATFDSAVASFLFCVLSSELQAPALRELGRVLKRGGTLRLLEYVRPKGASRAFVAALWEPWMAWAYGAGFDRNTESHVRDTDLRVVESCFVVPDLIKIVTLRSRPAC